MNPKRELSEAEETRRLRDINPDDMFGSRNFDSKFIQFPGLDIGYIGAMGAEPIYGFTGIDLDVPGYYGLELPYADESFMTVHASHVLEHCSQSVRTIKEWFRVVKEGGHLIITVPHQYLYEKKIRPPSNWNEDHKRFYTPGILLMEVELALPANFYRIIYCRDNDEGYDYSIGPHKHSHGRYEIECIIQRIKPPNWALIP